MLKLGCQDVKALTFVLQLNLENKLDLKENSNILNITLIKYSAIFWDNYSAV